MTRKCTRMHRFTLKIRREVSPVPHLTPHLPHITLHLPHLASSWPSAIRSPRSSSADADKPARHLQRSVTVRVTIPYARCSFLVRNSNFVFKTSCSSDIRLQKCRYLEISRSPGMLPFDRAHTTSYWRSVLGMALSRFVSELFDFKKCHDLEIRVRGHWNSLKVGPLDRLGMVSY